MIKNSPVVGFIAENEYVSLKCFQILDNEAGFFWSDF